MVLVDGGYVAGARLLGKGFWDVVDFIDIQWMSLRVVGNTEW